MAYIDTHVQALSKAFDANWPGLRGEKFVLTSNDLCVEVFKDDGARISSLKHLGVELLRQWNQDRKAFQYGSFPMIPWVGRLKGGDILYKNNKYHLYVNKSGNAMHGMAHFSDWMVVSYTNNSLILKNIVGEPWPFQTEVIQYISLNNNILTMKLQINALNCDFPADAGWHPWFLKDPDNVGSEQLDIKFQADDMEEIGIDEVPTGKKLNIKEGPYDDCFNFYNGKASAQLIYPNKRKITLTSNGKALIIFNKQPDAACVNPMTGVPNGINTNPNIVQKDKPLVLESKWVFEKL